MATTLPLAIRLSVIGLLGTVGLVVGAVALRSSSYDVTEEDLPADAGPSAQPASSSTAPRPSARPPSTSPPAGTARSPATPSPPTAAPPPAADAREARAALRRELQLGRYGTATEALARLVEVDPRAAEDGEVRADIVELAMRVMLLTGNEPDRVFEMIAGKIGTTGIDILYELLTTRGGSRAASRAEEVLQDEKVRARGTPALRIAYDLRQTHDCEAKKALFHRAKADGDGRALGQLQLLGRRCGRHANACCLQNDPALREAMDGIKARLN
jgi:hypothetical protein